MCLKGFHEEAIGQEVHPDCLLCAQLQTGRQSCKDAFYCTLVVQSVVMKRLLRARHLAKLWEWRVNRTEWVLLPTCSHQAALVGGPRGTPSVLILIVRQSVPMAADKCNMKLREKGSFTFT